MLGRLVLSVPHSSFDGRYYAAYPNGDAPPTILSSGAAAGAVVTGDLSTGGGPLNLPLANSSNLSITYLGAFQLPSNGNFLYNGSISVTPDGAQLYITHYTGSTWQCGAINIPAPTGAGGTYTGSEQATQAVAPASVNWGSNNVITGALKVGTKAYVTHAIAYDAGGTQTVFLTPMNADMTGQGSPCGVSGSAGSIPRMFSNGMAKLPSVWQPYFGPNGETHFISGGPGGFAGLSIISQQCCGYGFSTFTPANIVGGQPVTMNEWLNYPFTDGGSGDPQHVSVLSSYAPAQYNQSNWSGKGSSSGLFGNHYITTYDRPVGTAFIPDGSRSLLYLHCHSYGPAGDPALCNCGTPSGCNEQPFAPDVQDYVRIQITAYDLLDLYNNRHSPGSTDASGNALNGHVYDPRPYGWWRASPIETALGYTGPSQTTWCPIQSGGAWNHNSWATYDPNAQADGTHRLYVTESNDVLHVFSVGHL